MPANHSSYPATLPRPMAPASVGRIVVMPPSHVTRRLGRPAFAGPSLVEGPHGWPGGVIASTTEDSINRHRAPGSCFRSEIGQCRSAS